MWFIVLSGACSISGENRRKGSSCLRRVTQRVKGWQKVSQEQELLSHCDPRTPPSMRNPPPGPCQPLRTGPKTEFWVVLSSAVVNRPMWGSAGPQRREAWTCLPAYLFSAETGKAQKGTRLLTPPSLPLPPSSTIFSPSRAHGTSFPQQTFSHVYFTEETMIDRQSAYKETWV